MNETISVVIELREDLAREMTSSQFDALAELCPDKVNVSFQGKNMVLSPIACDGELAKKLIDEALKVGIDIWSQNFVRSGFSVSLLRSFDSNDLDEVSFIHSCDAGGTYLGEVDYPLSCDSHGVPALAGKPRQKSRMFGTPEPLHPSFFVIRGEAKLKMERVGFKGLRLYPIMFNRARSLTDEDLLWAVWSDMVLPSTKNLFRTDAGEMGFAGVVSERAKNAGPTKGFLTKPEIHYRKEDLCEFGEFDVALMREPLKIHGTFSSRPVFSQRFRRFVIDELDVPFGGVPVCIDDDDIIPWEGPYPSKWSHLNQRPEWLEKLQAEVSRGKKI